MAKCKRCSLKTMLSNEDIQKMIDEVTNMQGIRLVSEEIYTARFNCCKNCDSFLYNSTCSVCGCVIQVRARLSDGKCPKRKWAK